MGFQLPAEKEISFLAGLDPEISAAKDDWLFPGNYRSEIGRDFRRPSGLEVADLGPQSVSQISSRVLGITRKNFSSIGPKMGK